MSAPRHLSLLLGACVLWGFSSPAQAQSTRERLDALETRVTQLEAVLQGAALVELSQGVAAQEADLRTLRGELETLQEALATLRREQGAFAADVDRRLSALEARATSQPAATPATSAVNPAATTTETPAPAGATVAAPLSTEGSFDAAASTAPATRAPVAPGIEPGVLYGQGFDALKAGRYAEAIETLKTFRLQFPDHPLADNAAYWLGQSYYVSREYALAIEAFAAVGDRSADPGKAPDALLKKGLCEIELRRPEAARASFEAVIARYPDSASATQARAQLDALR